MSAVLLRVNPLNCSGTKCVPLLSPTLCCVITFLLAESAVQVLRLQSVRFSGL